MHRGLIDQQRRERLQEANEQSPAMVRVRRDMLDCQSLDKRQFRIEPKDPRHPDEFEVRVSPIEGTYRGGVFMFTIKIPPDYPTAAPQVHCGVTLVLSFCAYFLDVVTETRCFHPNIDEDPNPHDPLNAEAATLFGNDRQAFDRLAQQYVRMYARCR